MPASNLALIISPNIIRNRDAGARLLDEIKQSNIVLEMMMEHHEMLFQNVKKQSTEPSGSASVSASTTAMSASGDAKPEGQKENLVDSLGSSGSNPKIRRRKSEPRVKEVKRDSMHKRVTSSGNCVLLARLIRRFELAIQHCWPQDQCQYQPVPSVEIAGARWG